MKMCHVCLTNCSDDAELCHVCGADLTVKEEKAVEIKKPVFLTKFEDIVTAEIFEDLLKDKKISFFAEEDDQGSLRVIFGGAFFTKEIYVDESQLSSAQELLTYFIDNQEKFMGEFVETFEDEI